MTRVFWLAMLVFCARSIALSQSGQGAATTTAPGGSESQIAAKEPTSDPTPATKTDIAKLRSDLLSTDKDDFQLTVGIGSLIGASGASDYNNQSNILQSTNLGRATPQYLVGVSLRTPFRNIGHYAKSRCPAPQPREDAGFSPDAVPIRTADVSALPTAPPPSAGPVLPETPNPNARAGSRVTRGASKPNKESEDFVQPCWNQNPWKAFVSLKFAAGSSQALSGFVLGGSYQFGHYVDALLGFGLTPFNEASPGLRTVASQYVTTQQKLGNLTAFDPTAMLAGSKNAFDGFSLLDSNGKLIYTGTPLEVHYRGGVVVGISIPISLGSAIGGK